MYASPGPHPYSVTLQQSSEAGTFSFLTPSPILNANVYSTSLCLPILIFT